MNMEYIKFKDLTTSTQYGYTASETSPTNGKYKYLRITDIVPYFVNFKTVPFCEISEKQVPKYIVHEGDILVARTGATTGYNYVVPKGIDNTVYASYLIRFVVDRSFVLPLYMKYVLKSQSYYGFVNNYIGGSAQPGMNAKVFGKFNVPYHPLEQQQKIASILSTYDTLIENNTKRIRLLEKMAENLYKEWFVRFRFPGHENVEMENGLPKGWKNYSLRDLCDINKNTISSKRKDELIHYLDTSAITNNNIAGYEDYILKDAPSRAKRVVKHNSIIFSTVRPNLRHLGILKNPVENTIVSTGFAVFDCKYDIANIVYRFLSSSEIVNYCQSIAEGAVATYPSIKPEEIARIKVTLPSIEKAVYMNRQFEKLISEQNLLTKQNSLLTRQRDLLLPRLMSGKLEVIVR